VLGSRLAADSSYYAVSKKPRTSHLAPSLALASLALSGVAFSQADVYVDIVAGGDTAPGTDWSVAVKSIPEALNRAAIPGVSEIWVKAYANQTHYVPSTSAGRSESFVLSSGVVLRGGFQGTEVTLDDRPTNLFDSTVLSGDIGMTPNNRSDDAFHVVTLLSGGFTILDGFRVVSGNANGSGIDALGGGLTTDMSSGGNPDLQLLNLTFQNNHADERGGGMFLSRTSGVVSRVVCRDNSCLKQNSPGSFTGQGGGASLDQCGPGLYFFNSVFDGNRSIQGGGLHQTLPNAEPILFQNCLWTDNLAQSGGGLYFKDAGGTTSLSHCTVAYNIVGTTVGSAGGAGIRVVGSGAGALDIQSSIVYRNQGTFYSPGNPPLQNPNSVETDTSTIVSATNSCIQLSLLVATGPSSGTPAWFDATTCIQVDPEFTNGPTRDFTLAPTSPCLDAGNDSDLEQDLADLDGNMNFTELTPLDLGEQPREVDVPVVDTGSDGGNIVGAVTDMGAFERQSQ
jgi:hypothetical protein